MATLASATTETASSFMGGFWSAVPSMLWFLLVLAALVLFRKELSLLLQNLSWRLRTGAPMKFFAIELGQSYVSQSIDRGQAEAALANRVDEDGERWNERRQYYEPSRKILLVHRLAPSKVPRMLYDIQLYLIPHREATLACVLRVEYYFGRHWGNRIFTAIDRANGFPITTSAFGPFMCTARLFFTDGEAVVINRYVDFEMGAIGTKGDPAIT